MKIITDKNRIEEIFNRGIVVDVLPLKNNYKKAADRRAAKNLHRG